MEEKRRGPGPGLRRALQAVFVLAVLALVFFAVRLAISTAVWTDPGRQDQPLAGWMTPRYVALSWRLPPEVVAQALEISQDGSGRRVTLEEIAEAQGVPVENVIAALEAAIAAHREAAPRD